jgi:hypothetical protein
MTLTSTPREIGGRARDSQTHTQNWQGGTAAEAGDPMAWFKRQGSTTHFDVVDVAGIATGHKVITYRFGFKRAQRYIRP